MSVQGTPNTPGEVVNLEVGYKDGAGCGWSALPNAASVESSIESAPGKYSMVPFFVIIKNYYSPAYPSGDIASLANLTVHEGVLPGGTSAPLG